MAVERKHILEIWKQAGKKVTLDVCSNSMEPAIKVGDFISLHMSASVEYKPGDIVVFLRGDDIVVHRLIKKKSINGEFLFCEKGDNVCAWTWIAEKKLLGRVASIVDKNKIEKVPQRQFILNNRIMGFLGWCIVTFYEAVSPVKKLIPEKMQTHFIIKLKNLIVRINNRLLLLIGSVVCRT